VNTPDQYSSTRNSPYSPRNFCTPTLLPSAMEDDLSNRANERPNGSPPHTPCAPRPLPNSTRPCAVQSRLDWLPDHAPSHVRRNISACKGILILPHGTYVEVQYADQLLHAWDIVRLVQSSGVAPTKLIKTFGGVSGELFNESGLENILQYALHKNHSSLTVVWQEEYCCLEQLLTISTSSVLVHFIWRQVSFEMFFTIIHVLWRALRCPHFFHSSKSRTAIVCVLSVILTFLFLSSKLFDCFDLSTSS
jgi:hypothetical protein